MKTGFSTWSFLSLPPMKAVKKIASLGFETIELWGDIPHFWAGSMKNSEVKNLKNSLRPFGGNTSIHAPIVNLADKNPGLRKEAVRQTKETIKLAGLINCRYLTLHPGQKPYIMQDWDYSSEAILLNLDSICNLIEEARKCGVFLCLENVNGYIGETLPEMEDLIKNLNSNMIKVVLDIGHANLIFPQEIENFLEKFKKKLALIHVSDNHGKTDAHLPVGGGNINFKKVFRKIKQIKFNGPVIGEYRWRKNNPFENPKKYIKFLKSSG